MQGYGVKVPFNSLDCAGWFGYWTWAFWRSDGASFARDSVKLAEDSGGIDADLLSNFNTGGCSS